MIENLFDIPGIGYLLMDSIELRLSCYSRFVLFIGFFVVIINTIADLLTLLLDPKQRLQLGNPKIKTNTPLISESIVTVMHKIFSKNNLIFFVFVAFIFVVIVLQFFVVVVKMRPKSIYHKLLNLLVGCIY